MFLTAIAFLIGLSLLSSILVLAAVIRSGQVDRMTENSRRGPARQPSPDRELDSADAGLHLDVERKPDWTPTGSVASYPFSLHDRT